MDTGIADDPLPRRRAARRMLRRLDGMGKYGGYHTEFRHLARGFAGHERQLALEVGEALLRAATSPRSRPSASATSRSSPHAPRTSAR